MRRFLVQYYNTEFKSVTNNKMGDKFGLGTYAEDNPIALGGSSLEIVFYKTNLEEKIRKLKIIYDNFNQPASGYLYGSSDFMTENSWNFPSSQFPTVMQQERMKRFNNFAAKYIWSGESNSGGLIRLAELALADALFYENGKYEINAPQKNGTYKEHFPLTAQIPGAGTGQNAGVKESEVRVILDSIKKYVQQYIDLIHKIIAANDTTLSRAVDDVDTAEITVPIVINLETVQVPLLDTLLSASLEAINIKTTTFYNKDKEYNQGCI